MTYNNIMDKVQYHYNIVKEKYGEEKLLGVFLYGSQNYNFSTENSDVDTKAILIPNLEDLCLRRPVTKELHLDNGEHCEVKDIREMIKMFKKQNINFLEILYTDFCIINPKYEELWNNSFCKKAELISHMDYKKTILSITGQTLHTLKQNPYNGKKYADSLRLYYFLLNFIKGFSYKNCININYSVPNPKELFEYKNNKRKPSEHTIESLKKELLKLKDSAETYNKYNNTSEISKYLDLNAMKLITNNNIHFDFYKNL